MPEIKEYTADANVGGTVQQRRADPGEFNGGAGLAKLGAGIEQAAGAIHHADLVNQRAANSADISDLNAKLSASHAASVVGFQEALRTAQPGDKTLVQGALDTHDADMAEIQGDIKTPAGQKYFNQRQAAIRGDLLITASHGQAALAAEKARQDILNSADQNSSRLMADPSGLAQAIDGQDHYTQLQVENGGLSQIHKQELDAQVNTQYAKASIMGWIRNGDSGPQQAKARLDNQDPAQGIVYSKYLNADEKAVMDGQIQTAVHAQQAEAARQQREADRLKDAHDEITNQGFLKDFTDHKLTGPTILNSDLDEKTKEHWFNMLKEGSSKGWHSDQDVVSDLLRRMDLPPGDPHRVNSQAQIMKYVGTQDTGNINMADATKLTSYYEKGTPQRQADAKSWSDFRNTVWGDIAKPDPGTHLPSTSALGLQADQVRQQLRDLEIKYRDKGIPAAQALNPSDPNYAGKFVHITPPTFMQRIESKIKYISDGAGDTGGSTPPPQSGNQPYTAPPKVGEVRGGLKFQGGYWKNKSTWAPVDGRSPQGHESDMQSIIDYENEQKAKDAASAPAPNTKARGAEVVGTTKDGHKIVTLKN